MPERKTVMISSTARDLPEHRKEAMDACLRQGMFPVMMEHLPASDAEAISASLAMVDAADTAPGRSRELMQWVHSDKGSGWSKGERGLRVSYEVAPSESTLAFPSRRGRIGNSVTGTA